MRRVLVPSPILQVATRDARYWPFTSTSAWNTPIRSGAIFTDKSEIRSTGANINYTAWSTSVAVHNPSYPLVSISQSNQCNEGTYFTPPPAQRIPSVPVTSNWPYGLDGSPPMTCYRDGMLCSVHSDGFAYGFNMFRKTSTTQALASYHSLYSWDHIVTGAGWPPAGYAYYGNGHWIAGNSLIGGLVRKEEIAEALAGSRQYFPHAIQASIPYSMLRQASTQQGTFKWPATFSDGGWSSYAGTIYMGELMAIPASFNIEATSWTASAKVLARTLQKFGLYIVAQGGGGLTLLFEIGSSSTFVNDVYTNLSAIRDQLRAVSNNDETHVGGGGTYPPTLWPVPTPIIP